METALPTPSRGVLARPGPCLGLIVLAAAILRGGAVYTTGTAIDRDAVLFFLQAESLMRGDVLSWFAVHTKPPVYSALVAGGMAVGLSAPVAAHAVSLLAGVAMLHPTWLILRRCGRTGTALLALALVAMLKGPVMSASRCLSDTTYGLLLLYGVYFLFIRGLLDGRLAAFCAAGVLGGLAYLTRTEGVFFILLGVGFIAAAGLWRKLPRRKAAAGGAVFVLSWAALAAPNVAAVSWQEGKLTLRRNVGQLMLYTAGATVSIKAFDGDAPTPGEVMARHGSKLAQAWAATFAKYLIDDGPYYAGYVAYVLLVLGVLGDVRRLWRWGPWQTTLAFFVLMLACLSIVPAHGRFLVGIIHLVGWSMARGAQVIADGLVRLNPLRLKNTRWVGPALAAVCLAAVAGTTLGAVLGQDRDRDKELRAAAEIIAARAVPGRTPRVATPEPVIAYRAGAEIIPISRHWNLTGEQLAEMLRGHEADFLAARIDQLKAFCPSIDPANPPGFLILVGEAAPYRLSRKAHPVVVYRVVAEAATGPADSADAPDGSP